MNTNVLSKTIKEKARSLGASLVGIASVHSVLKTPSHRYGTRFQGRFENGCFVVMALEHPASDPSLDWWNGQGGTPGNRKLQQISRSLQHWLKKDFEIASRILPYQAVRGGIFLKEAAVIAGLGIIGRNNLLVTPQYGTNVRLRAIYLKSDILPDEPVAFDPCKNCSAPCTAACPQHAFRNGKYQRTLCIIQMKKDEANQKRINMGNSTKYVIQYCRACEWVCSVTQRPINSNI